jgi:hypothetical protein
MPGTTTRTTTGTNVYDVSLDIGYWLLVIGYWLLVVGYWILVIGYWNTGILEYWNTGILVIVTR